MSDGPHVSLPSSSTLSWLVGAGTVIGFSWAAITQGCNAHDRRKELDGKAADAYDAVFNKVDGISLRMKVLEGEVGWHTKVLQKQKPQDEP